MTVTVWIQLGSERREVQFDVPDGDLLLKDRDELEKQIKELAWAWVACRFGWGVRCPLFSADYSFNEGYEMPKGHPVAALNAATEYMRSGKGDNRDLEALETLGLIETRVNPINGVLEFRFTTRMAAVTKSGDRLLELMLDTAPSQN